MDEQALLAKAQSGDREALGELLMAHREACYALALRLTANAADAEDVCQDAFVRASRDVGSAGLIANLRSWLFKLVVHSYGRRARSDGARRRREGSRAMEREAAAADSSGELERTELRRGLGESLGQLDDNQRLPIVLHYQQGLSYAEAAAVLEMPEGTVATNIRRGLGELRGMLARAGYGVAALGGLEALLAQAPAVSAPASLAVFIKSLAAGLPAEALAKAGAAAGGLAIGWKVAAGLTLAAALGVGGFAGWQRFHPAAAAAPAPEPRAAAAPELPPGEALGRPVTLTLRGADYRWALSRISAQTGLVWTPPNDRLVPAGRVTLKVEGTATRKVLDELARSAGLVWKEGPGGIAVFNQECPDFEARLAALGAAAGGDEAARAEALYRLGYAGDMRALPHLVGAMADRSLLVRCWAAGLLNDYMAAERGVRTGRQYVYRQGRTVDAWSPWLAADGRAALVTALLAPEALPAGVQGGGTLRYAGPEVRLSLLACLDDDERARAAILKGLESREAEERRAAVWACRLSPRDAYGEKLLAMVAAADRDETLRLAGTLSCFPGERFRREWLRLQSEKVAGLGHILSGIGSEDTWAIPQLLETVKSGPAGRIYDAAGALEKFAGTDQAAEISECLAARYRQAPAGAVYSRYLLGALAALGRPEGRAALLHALEHPVHGLDLCEKLGAAAKWPGPDEKLEDKVLAIARSEDPNYGEVRRWAVLALGSLGGRRSVEHLADAARKTPDDAWKSAAALEGLARMQARVPEARAALAGLAEPAGKAAFGQLAVQAWLSLPAGAPEQEAAALLRIAGSAAGTPEAERPARKGLLARAAMRAAGLGGDAVTAALRRMADDESPLVRAAAAHGMRSYPDRAFAAELVKLAGDADKDVAGAAASTLSWEYFRGWPGKALAERSLAGDARDRLVALKAMGGLACWQSAAEHFEALARLAGGDGEEAALARTVLTANGWAGGSPRAVGWMIEELKSPDQARRQAARSALQHNLRDLRAAPALEEDAKAHPEEVRRPPAVPGPVKPPEPPEVF